MRPLKKSQVKFPYFFNFRRGTAHQFYNSTFHFISDATIETGTKKCVCPIYFFSCIRYILSSECQNLQFFRSTSWIWFCIWFCLETSCWYWTFEDSKSLIWFNFLMFLFLYVGVVDCFGESPRFKNSKKNFLTSVEEHLITSTILATKLKIIFHSFASLNDWTNNHRKPQNRWIYRSKIQKRQNSIEMPKSLKIRKMA